MKSERILLVEDDAGSRDALAELLLDEGYEVLAVATGTEALHRAPEWGPDLAIVDVGLPDTDGFRVLRGLSESVPGCSVIIVSGSTDLVLQDGLLELRDFEQQALEAGAKGFFHKPIDVMKLIACFNQILDDSGV